MNKGIEIKVNVPSITQEQFDNLPPYLQYSIFHHNRGLGYKLPRIIKMDDQAKQKILLGIDRI